jgi:diaminohydroxyphosphoribosylaminopyrimidine deaminase/5-amino-6-(5-phosphoribosylamino)uracil reductase
MLPHDFEMLALAARLALRGVGRVEPNPMVGCVLAQELRGNEPRIIGLGHHRVFGGLHAEAEALADARRRGEDPRGCTAYVTLEPCHAHGHQPPCSRALFDAGVSRVVFARRDPNPAKAGGAAWLASQGIACEHAPLTNTTLLARCVGAGFVKRAATDLPWVIAKWAQQPAGEMRFGVDGSRWISSEASRRRVQRLRSRVDAIVTGIGTVLADDPRLTVRIDRPRRRPMRVVMDREARLPTDSSLVATIHESPLLIIHCDPATAPRETHARVEALRAIGVPAHDLCDAPGIQRLDLRAALSWLRASHHASTVLIEAGPTLLTGALERGLVDQAVVYVPGRHEFDSAIAGPVVHALRASGEWICARRRIVASDTEFTLIRRDRLEESRPQC